MFSDLTVISPSVSNSTPQPGQSFNVNATVRNQGSGTSNTTTVLRFYRSGNSIISSGDTEIGSRTIGTLSASASNSQSVTAFAPSAGTYYYGACVEASGNESSIANNCSAGVLVTVPSGIPADAYEPDDTAGTAKSISAGETQTRNIHVVGNYDWIRFDLTENAESVVFETLDAGIFGDTVLTLYDSSLNFVAEDDDGGEGLFSRLEMSELPTGTYYIRIRDWGNDDTIGAYALRVNVNNSDILDFLPAIIAGSQSKKSKE